MKWASTLDAVWGTSRTGNIPAGPGPGPFGGQKYVSSAEHFLRPVGLWVPRRAEDRREHSQCLHALARAHLDVTGAFPGTDTDPGTDTLPHC